MNATVIMQIAVDPSGNLTVQHALPSLIEAYGYLEAAKASLTMHAMKQQEKPQLFIAPPGTKVPEPPANGKHKPRLTS